MLGCWDVNGEGGESESAMFWGLGHTGTALEGESIDWETLTVQLDMWPGSVTPATKSFLGGPSDSTPPFLFKGATTGHLTDELTDPPLNLLVGLGEELGVTPESWEWKSGDRCPCHWVPGGEGTVAEALSLCKLPRRVSSIFSICRLWSGLSLHKENGEKGRVLEGQLGFTDTLLRRYRAEVFELNTVIPSLTLVIIGALLDLRKAPPPFPPAAPAHWSTSILSMARWQAGVCLKQAAGLSALHSGESLNSSAAKAWPAGRTLKVLGPI